MNKFIVLFCGIAVIGTADSETLTLQRALELAQIHSPELRAVQLHAQAAEKGVEASGLWKNPKLKFEAEGVGWDNDLFSEGEYSLGLMQEFQLGGKRKKARNAALKSIDVAGFVLAERQLGLADAVRKAFVEVVYLQESGKVQAEQEELGRAFVEVAKRRHEAGAGSELESVQAELELEKILFAQTCCLGELIAAQERLASLIGVSLLDLPELTALYFELKTIEDLLLSDTHPTLRRLGAEADKIRAEARSAKAQDVANISLGAGYKYEAAGDINTFVFSASMPLSFSKRGRAEYAEGLLRTDAVLTEREEARRMLQAELSAARALYRGAKMQAELSQKNLIPKAERAYELSRAGYEAGRFSWLELIASQQHLAELRIGYIEALKEAHLARIEILKLNPRGNEL